jgi:hypothetical protein
MPLKHLEALVEEPSMEAVLQTLLPQLIGTATFRIYAHNSKDTLLMRLAGRLGAYRQMLQPGWLVLVLVDQDDEDCRALKRSLEQAATAADLVSRVGAAGGEFSVLNRIVIEELEAWYFGDWQAVRKAYPRVPPRIASRAMDPARNTSRSFQVFRDALLEVAAT